MRWALSNLFRPGQSALTLLHVVPDIYDGPAPGSTYFDAAYDPELEAAVEDADRDIIQRYFVAEATAAGIPVRLVCVKESTTHHTGAAIAAAAVQLQARGLRRGMGEEIRAAGAGTCPKALPSRDTLIPTRPAPPGKPPGGGPASKGIPGGHAARLYGPVLRQPLLYARRPGACARRRVKQAGRQARSLGGAP